MAPFQLPALIPSDAFGDGRHPTTLLCARAVDFLCREGKLNSVLDVGTGTGILARIARSRGASFVVATDTDPIALESARRNRELDASPIPIVIADATAFPSGEWPESWDHRFDLVVANILEEVLRELASPLSRALALRGHLLLSGFTRLQVPSLEIAFTALGLKIQSCSSDGDWCLLHLRKKSED